MKKGSVLVFTLMITTVLLSIGFVFLDIIYRETERQRYSEKSQRAFLIADTAWECAIYNDFQLLSFSFSNPRRSALECDSPDRDTKVYGYKKKWEDEYVPEPYTRSNCDDNDASYSFVVTEGDFDTPAPCAEVGINKSCAGGGVTTTISVLGYDFCKSPTLNDDSIGGRGEVSRRFVIKYDEL